MAVNTLYDSSTW